MSWILFSIAASFLWAVTNIIDKYVVSKLVSKPMVPVIVLGLVGFASSLLVILTQGYQAMSVTDIGIALVAGVAYTVLNYAYFYAATMEEISKVVPLFYFAPLFIAIAAAYTLGEVFTPEKYIGIALLVIGAILISSGLTFSFRFGKAFWLMAMASVFAAIASLLTKYLLEKNDIWTVYALVRIGTMLVLVPALISYWGDFRSLWRESGIRPFAFMTLSEVLNQAAIILFTFAAALGFITLVSALGSLQPFFVLLFAIIMSLAWPHILEEEIGGKTVPVKALAIATMFAGVFLIS